jgi:hypothetical protein
MMAERQQSYRAGVAPATMLGPASVVIPRLQEQPNHPGPFMRSGVQDAGASSTASMHDTERRILEHPNDIRAAARYYAQAFKAYGDELRRKNDR